MENDPTLSLIECREIFEVKAKDHYRLNRRQDGHYLDLPTEAAWKGWQNCWQYFTEVKRCEISDNKISAGLKDAIDGKGKSTRYVVHGGEVGGVAERPLGSPLKYTDGTSSREYDDQPDEMLTIRLLEEEKELMPLTENCRGWNDGLQRAIEIVKHCKPKRESGWQPIETAPKDGTKFLAIMSGFQPSVGWWTEKFGWMNDAWNEQLEIADEDEMYEPTICGPWEPTHWMPIPLLTKPTSIEDESETRQGDQKP